MTKARAKPKPKTKGHSQGVYFSYPQTVVCKKVSFKGDRVHIKCLDGKELKIKVKDFMFSQVLVGGARSVTYVVHSIWPIPMGVEPIDHSDDIGSTVINGARTYFNRRLYGSSTYISRKNE